MHLTLLRKWMRSGAAIDRSGGLIQTVSLVGAVGEEVCTNREIRNPHIHPSPNTHTLVHPHTHTPIHTHTTNKHATRKPSYTPYKRPKYISLHHCTSAPLHHYNTTLRYTASLHHTFIRTKQADIKPTGNLRLMVPFFLVRPARSAPETAAGFVTQRKWYYLNAAQSSIVVFFFCVC